jgi:hypothetical protein
MWLVLILTFLMVVGPHANSDALFDDYQCRSDCSFRYNVRRDISGAVMLPFDSIKRMGYEKCLEDCEKKSFSEPEDSK